MTVSSKIDLQHTGIDIPDAPSGKDESASVPLFSSKHPNKKLYRTLALFSLVFVPICTAMIFVCAVPLSGAYDASSYINPYVFGWYFMLIYYCSTVAVPQFLAAFTLFMLPWPLWLGSDVIFLIGIALIFQNNTDPNTPVVFLFAGIGFLLYFLLSLVYALFRRCRNSGMTPRRWLIASMNAILTFSLYYFCVLMLNVLRQQQSGAQVPISLTFQVVTLIQRSASWNIGQLHESFTDFRLVHVGHMNVAISHLIYFMFYRVMFQELSSPLVFAFLQLFAVALDLFTYVILLLPIVRRLRSRLINGIVDRFQRCCRCCFTRSYRQPVNTSTLHTQLLPKGNVQTSQTDAEIQMVFRQAAVEYILRHICNLVSLANYLSLAIFIPLIDYAAPHYSPLFDDKRVIIYVAVSAGVDLFSVCLTSLAWRKLFHRSLWSHFWSFMHRPRYRHFGLMILFGVHVSHDLVVATLARG